MTPARVRAVAFDLDGTLVDSRLDLADAVNRMRTELGLEPLTIDAVLTLVGAGARNLVRRALGGAAPEALFERGFAAFLRHYDAVCTRETRPYPEIDEMLAALPAELPLAVVSNKPERFSRRIVEHLGWGARFMDVVGGDTLPTRKPSPEGLLRVAARASVAPQELLFVGDSAIDAAASDAAGCPLGLASWGFAGAEERRALAARRWLERPLELLALLAGA